MIMKIEVGMASPDMPSSGPHIESWASEAKWQVRVLKKYQDGRFLVGSDTVKPDQRLAMNSQEILIVEHQDRKPATKPLVAGTLKSTDKGKDPFMTEGGDPWQKIRALCLIMA